MSIEIYPKAKLPKELAHLSQYEKYCRKLKEGVYGFFINQFNPDGTKNPDWYLFRINTLGASETATACKNGYDEYGVRAKLFWGKLGKTFPEIKSKFTFWGLELESKVAQGWRYYDATPEGYIDNRYAGKVVREYQELNCYAINIKYPFLSASFDFLVPENQVNPFTGEVISFSYPLEIKTISTAAAEKYELGLPVRYIFQTHQQMLIWEVDYCEIAVLKGGTDFEVYPINMNNGIKQMVIEETKEFWDLVELARPIYEELDVTFDEKYKNELTAQLDDLEPEPEHNKGYEDFWKEKYKEGTKKNQVQGTEEHWDIAVGYKTILDQEKELSEKKQLYKNNLLYILKDADEIDFGENGRVVHRNNEGQRAYFGVNIKNYK
jgi:hypothetical protein